MLFLKLSLMTKKEELDYIATLTDQQVCTIYNTDSRQEIIDIIQDEDEDLDDEDEDYWNDYAEDMIISRNQEYALWMMN